METTERVRLLIAPLLEETDAELYDIEFTSGVLRITLDQSGGVDMGAIGSFTRALSRLLDETDPIAGQFTLEVSSPGLERVLRTVEHFERAIGESVAVKTKAGGEAPRRCTGALTAADSESITVEPADGSPAVRIPLPEIDRARTVFDWGPAPKPGRPKSSTSAKKKAAKS